VSASCEPPVVVDRSRRQADYRGVARSLQHRVALQCLGYVAPEEFKHLSPNGECGKQQAEPEGGTVLDASSVQS